MTQIKPSAAKRRVRRTLVPPASGYSWAWKSTIFNETDPADLAEAAGLQLVETCNARTATSELEVAFQQAIIWNGLNNRTPSIQHVLDFLLTVEAQVSELLKTLGLNKKHSPTLGSAQATATNVQPWFIHVAGGLNGLNPPAFWTEVVEGVIRKTLWQVAFPDTPVAADGTSEERRRRADANTARALLEIVPVVLRTLLASAEQARLVAETVPHRKGRRADGFNWHLFVGLHDAHCTMFGRKPITHDASRERGGSGVVWVRQVIELAATRIEKIFITPEEEVVGVIVDLSKLSDDRFADLLRQGARASKLRRSAFNPAP